MAAASCFPELMRRALTKLLSYLVHLAGVLPDPRLEEGSGWRQLNNSEVPSLDWEFFCLAIYKLRSWATPSGFSGSKGQTLSLNTQGTVLRGGPGARLENGEQEAPPDTISFSDHVELVPRRVTAGGSLRGRAPVDASPDQLALSGSKDRVQNC